jgi:phage tail tape-measure protein
MCPACLTSIALIAATGAGTAGGVAALVWKRLRGRRTDMARSTTSEPATPRTPVCTTHS